MKLKKLSNYSNHEELEIEASEAATIGLGHLIDAIRGTRESLSESIEVIRAILDDVYADIISD
jgi:hypothetical protein